MPTQKKPNSQTSKPSPPGKTERPAKVSPAKKSQSSQTKKVPKKPAASGNKKGSNPHGLPDQNVEATIAARAYELYEERCRLGGPMQDWLRAEQEILAAVKLKPKK